MMSKMVTSAIEPQATNSNSQSNSNSNSTTVVAGVMSVAILSAGTYGLNYLWKWMTEPSPLNKEDLKRYRALVSAHKKIDSTLPEQWKLSETDQPTFLLYKPLVMQSLHEKMHILTMQNSAESLALVSILALIHRFLECLEARNWFEDYAYDAYDRPNGVEAMFLVEMIKWLDTVPLLLRDDPKKTIDTFAKRILYCKEVRLHLAKNKYLNRERANFKDFIQELTAELEQYHQHLVHKFESMNFNDLVNQLSDNILGLSAQSLTMMYLLTNGADQSALIVQRCINPSESDVGMRALQKKQLGQWLLKTLDAAGIYDSTFESNTILTMEQVTQHLQGLHPEDSRDELTALQPPGVLSEAWGHWSFVLKPSDAFLNTELSSQRQRHRLFSRVPTTQSHTARVSTYLSQIRELQSITLEFYFIRQNLIRTATVASVFGEIWVYGDNVGKAVLDELLCAVSDIVQKYNFTFDEFWTSYFAQHYTTYSIIHNEDDISHAAHRWLSAIDQEKKVCAEQTILTILDLIDRIRAHALKLPQHLKNIKRTKKALFLDVLKYLEIKEKTDSPNYKIISEGLNILDTNQSTPVSAVLQHLPGEKRTAMSSEMNRIIEKEVQRRIEQMTAQSIPEKTEKGGAQIPAKQASLGSESHVSAEIETLLAKYVDSPQNTTLSDLRADTKAMASDISALFKQVEQHKETIEQGLNGIPENLS